MQCIGTYHVLALTPQYIIGILIIGVLNPNPNSFENMMENGLLAPQEQILHFSCFQWSHFSEGSKCISSSL